MISWLKTVFSKESACAEEPRLNPPASEAAIAAAEEKLNVRLPYELRRRYLRYDGIEERHMGQLVYRLMPLREAIQINQHLVESSPRAEVYANHSLRLFFSGDDHAGVFCAEPFSGWLFFDHHDSAYLGDLSPIFSSIASFEEKCSALKSRKASIRAWEQEFANGELAEHEAVTLGRCFGDQLLFPNEGPEDVAAMPVDFPAGAATQKLESAHRYCMQRIKADEFSSEEELRFLVYTAVRTATPERIGECASFLTSDDYYIPGRVASIMSARHNPNLFRMFVEHECLDPDNPERDSPSSLLALITLRKPDSKDPILAEYQRQGRNSADYLERLEELISNPPVHF